MNIDKKQIIEITGALAIVASLVFVGMQLMFDRQVALGEQYFNRAESQKEDIRSTLTIEGYMQLREERWDNGIRPPWWTESSENYYKERDFTSFDIVHGLEFEYMRLISFDNLYFQYEQGLLAEEFWLTARDALKSSLNIPIPRGVYTNQLLQRPIVKVINELLAEIESEL